jgi:hypothetical protein
MAEPAFQLVGIRASGLGQLETERVAQIMRPERGNVPLGVGDLGIMPAPDLLQDAID